jgi:hypothetical protein
MHALSRCWYSACSRIIITVLTETSASTATGARPHGLPSFDG